MRKQHLNPKELFDPRFFTHTVTVSGPLRLVYVSGQVSYDRDGHVIGEGDMKAQTEQVFKSLTYNLAAAGATWDDVVKLNGYMVNMNPDDVSLYREARMCFLNPKKPPASTLVGVSRLVHEDLLLEVEVVAAVADTPAKPAPKKKVQKKR
ncbi:MAG: RidA family protein [Proteobacteria bacterium]|nr:RidA family protein [Pseudomonadota bacterium]